MLKCHTAHSPLIEPDMKISLIRLLQRLSSQAMRRPPTGFLLQVHQTHAVEVLVVSYSFGWPKGPLASTSHVLRKTLTYVGIDLSKTLARITVAKVVRPSFEMCVELLDELRQRHEAALLADHLTQFLPFSSPSLLRDGHVEVTLLASLSIAIIAKRVSQEIKLLSFSLKVHYPRLVPIDLQPHPLFKLGLNPPLKLLSLITRQHHKVIDIADQLSVCPVGWPRHPMKHLVKPVKIQIRQQGGYHASLRRSLTVALARARSSSASSFDPLHHRRFKPHPNQLKHRSIDHPHPYARHKPLMRDRIKVALKIGVIHRLIPGSYVTAYLFKRLVRISLRAKPIATVLKVRLKDRLQYQQICRLHYPVAYRRDSQRPFPPVRFVDVDAPYCLGLIGLGPKLLVKPVYQTLGSSGGFLDGLNTHAVKPGFSPIRSNLLPGRPKHVLPIDPVIQRVKPKLRLRLGLLTKLMSQKRKFPCALAFGLRRDKLQLFRSGIFIQAAFPLSSISISLLRPLRSTVVTRFFATMGLSDSRQRPTKSYLFLLAVLAPAGLPGSFADLCTRAAPFHLEEPNDCSCPLLHRRFQASSSLADWPLLFSVTRPKTGSLALRLACSPCKASPAELLPLTLARLLVERATYKISSFQNIRSARLILALQRRKGRQGKRKLDKTRDLN